MSFGRVATTTPTRSPNPKARSYVLRANPRLEPAKVAPSLRNSAKTPTARSAPGVTLEHIARSIENGRRCLLLAWPNTTASIAQRLDEHHECMRTFSGEDGAHRLYNANGDVRAGPDELKVYRRGDGQNKWLFHEKTGEVELQANGETIATFDDPEDVFADPTAYPATEKDLKDFLRWTAIKCPALPGRINRDTVDMIAVTADGFEVLEPSGDRTPIAELLDDADEADETKDDGAGEGSPVDQCW